MKKYCAVLLKSLLAGIMVGIGGTVYLSNENAVIGAFLFTIGLFSIVSTSVFKDI